MPRYLISLDESWMNHPDEVTEAAGQGISAVMQEAAHAGNFVLPPACRSKAEPPSSPSTGASPTGRTREEGVDRRLCPPKLCPNATPPSPGPPESPRPAASRRKCVSSSRTSPLTGGWPPAT